MSASGPGRRLLLIAGVVVVAVRRRRRAAGGEVLDVAHDERRPPGLVARAEAAPGVAVEVLVEQHELVPERVAPEALVAAVHRLEPFHRGSRSM